MANISDNTNLNGHVDLTADGKQNWISQINAGGTVYDIATHHGITFREGNGGAATVWNGLTDLEVVIPSIADIVQSPIEFAGTVGADGVVSYNDTHKDGPKEGYLVFVTADCTFGGLACEAGDMAIYADSKWNIVSGENQVKIVNATDKDITDANRTVVAVGAAKDVLVVEGKALSLTLDYADLNDHVEITKGDEVGVNFKNITVGNAYVKLSQETGTKVTVGEDVKFDRATALKDGKVLINLDKVVTEVSFGKLNPGSFPTVTKNGVTNLDVTGGSVVKGDGNDFVSSVAVKPVTFDKANDGDQNKITVISSLIPGTGTEFFSGIHATTTDETADLTIKGYAVPTDGMNVKFVKAWEDSSLAPVTSITDGDFKLVDGSVLVTGLEGGVTGVVTAVSATVNNDTDVFSSASVTDHVLTFGTTKVASGVTVTPTITNLTKTGFQYTAPKATTTAFVTGGFTNVADTNYTFGRTKETTYSATPEMWKLNTPELTVNKGAYTLDRTGMKVTIGADLFATGLTGGELPSLGASNATKSDITATVGTELNFAEQTVHAVAAAASEITLPGAYTLSSADAAGDNTVLVGKAGKVAANEASVNLAGYLTDVKVVATKTKA